MPHDGSWHDADLVAVAERYRHPLVHRPGTRSGSGAGDGKGAGREVLPDPVEGLSVQGRGVAMTSLRRRGDWLELRLVAETPAHTTALVGAAGAPVAMARSCDLLGRGGQTLADLRVRDGVLRLPMRPWQMLTVQLRLGTSATTG